MSVLDGTGVATREAMDRSHRDETEIASEIRTFTGMNGDYYVRQFNRLDEAVEFGWSFNWAAAFFGPVWMAARRLWVLFWIFALFEALAVVQLTSGLWADLGRPELIRAQRLSTVAAERRAEAAKADDASRSAIEESAKALEEASQTARSNAASMEATRPRLIIIGLGLLILLKLAEGIIANWALNRRFAAWRGNRSLRTGINWVLTAGAAAFICAMYGLTAYRFAGRNIPAWLITFPADSSWRLGLSSAIDALIDRITSAGQGIFDGITASVNVMLNAMDAVLVSTPWPVTMSVIALIAFKRLGWRMALFTIAAMFYLATTGLWEESMATVALLGTASLICIVVGCPLGIWCAKSGHAYRIVRPILNLMQTMPPFVYLIPAIAFFGIGKPPGILATVIFGLSPMVHLTVLGIQGVPASVREAAIAFGASRRYLLLKVELPLALPSIMVGVSQTTLMCLSMVTVAALIGAKGLGEDILNALAQVAPGAGIVVGTAVLLCAIVLDRLLQGKRRRSEVKSDF